MHVRYGSFDFAPDEAYLTVHSEHKRSLRGHKLLQHLVFSIGGEVSRDTGEYDVNTRLREIVAAMSVDGQSCGLLHTDGTQTAHWMPNTADEPRNISDVQVISQSLPSTKNGEFVSGRNFEFQVSSLYLDPSSSILDYHDSLIRLGNAGPEYEWKRDKFWGHYPIVKSPTTLQTILHRGYAVGAYTWPTPPLPYYSPPFELNHRRQVAHESPKRYAAGYTSYRTTWAYIYHLPTFDDLSAPTVL